MIRQMDRSNIVCTDLPLRLLVLSQSMIATSQWKDLPSAARVTSGLVKWLFGHPYLDIKHLRNADVVVVSLFLGSMVSPKFGIDVDERLLDETDPVVSINQLWQFFPKTMEG
jgi:hypothetical protein